MPNQERDEYLEAILDIGGEKGNAKTTELARRLGVAPASVTEVLQRLCRDGLVGYQPYRGASLTGKGLDRANRIKRKHRLLELFLTRVLRIRQSRVHEEACKMEHSLSDETENALCRSLGGPDRCPHGRPIPPCGNDVPSCVECGSRIDQRPRKSRANVTPITALQPGEKATVSFIRGKKMAVQRLSNLGLTPGIAIVLLRAAPMSGPLEVRVRGCNLAIGRGIAEKIFVHKRRSAST